MNLGQIETGNAYFIKATFVATTVAPTAESTAVTFTVVDPAGTSVAVSSPDASITGPTVTTLDDGRKQTVWTLSASAETLPGRHTVRARSTAGLLASANAFFDVPAYVPLASA